MQVNIGEKIKELRKRDKRKQDDLANALGVTAQAVSRWEAGTCYPDMGLIPAIANYFHVSIDSLFGYNNDRECKIQECVKAADQFFTQNNGDPSEIIAILRRGLEEFPGEPKLQIRLASALVSQGWNSYGNKPNPQLEEAAALYEQLSKNDASVIPSLITVYSQMGAFDKAEEKAKSQSPIRQSREILLASIQGDTLSKYQGDAILSLLHELEFLINNAIAGNEKLKSSKEGLRILSAVRELYDAIFDGSDLSFCHSDLCMLSLRACRVAAAIKENEQALAYWELAYHHFSEYQKLMAEGRAGTPREVHFTAPLLADAKPDLCVVNCYPEYLITAFEKLPAKLQAKLEKDPRYNAILTKQ